MVLDSGIMPDVYSQEIPGFSSPSDFSQIFRRTQSVTPLEYRQSVEDL